MRSGLFTLVFLTAALPAAAQSVLDGPLAAPDDAPATPISARPATASHAKAKAKRVHHAAARPAGATPAEATPGAPGVPTAAPTGTAAPNDPVSLGMKWQGSNESAGQTRYDNLNGNAAGSGAEVGMKLHF